MGTMGYTPDDQWMLEHLATTPGLTGATMASLLSGIESNAQSRFAASKKAQQANFGTTTSNLEQLAQGGHNFAGANTYLNSQEALHPGMANNPRLEALMSQLYPGGAGSGQSPLYQAPPTQAGAGPGTGLDPFDVSVTQGVFGDALTALHGAAPSTSNPQGTKPMTLHEARMAILTPLQGRYTPEQLAQLYDLVGRAYAGAPAALRDAPQTYQEYQASLQGGTPGLTSMPTFMGRGGVGDTGGVPSTLEALAGPGQPPLTNPLNLP